MLSDEAVGFRREGEEGQQRQLSYRDLYVEVNRLADSLKAMAIRKGDLLRKEIKETVVRQLGKALQPGAVLFVRDLPKTRNAKIMRRVIRAAYLGRRDYGDLSALENPSALEEIARAA